MKRKIGKISSMFALFASAIALTGCCCDWNPCCERPRECCPRKQVCCPRPHCMGKPDCCDPSSYNLD